MKRTLKIVLSVLFALAVGLWVIKLLVHESPFEAVRRHAGFLRPKIERPAKPRPAPVAVLPQNPAMVVAPRIAIILDDWGRDYSVLQKAEELGRPLTLSILPALPKSRRIAEEAHAKGLGVMLHMPMQPQSDKEPLEAHTILVSSPEAQIRGYLDDALASVPFVEGVNNHQGSAATSDERVMRVFLGHLKSKGLFFVDSAVIRTSRGATLAKELGIPFTKRDVFIDNSLKSDAIKAELRRAAKIALKHGTCVVIGHDHKPTIQALKEMLPEIESQGIRLVLVKDLVHK